jgi:hypothetical protein
VDILKNKNKFDTKKQVKASRMPGIARSDTSGFLRVSMEILEQENELSACI